LCLLLRFFRLLSCFFFFLPPIFAVK
jgi:hypothetical protein